MKKTLLVLALAIPMMAAAQILEVASVEKLNTPQMDAKVAGISPDGSYVLLTTGHNEGLQKYDLATGQVSIITTAEGAGYNAKISADGKDVVYRETTTGADRLRRSKLVRQTLASKATSTIVGETRDLEGYAIHGNAVVAVNKRKVSRAGAPTVVRPVVSIKDRQLMISRGEESVVLSPNGTHLSYLWPSISPDGTKICYYIAGNGCWVANIDGSNPQYIAHKCRAAQWYNNNTIIAMADEDDGHVLTASAIVAYTLDGKKQVLTSSNLIAVYPYASVDGKKIAFSTEQGEAYMLNIK